MVEEETPKVEVASKEEVAAVKKEIAEEIKIEPPKDTNSLIDQANEVNKTRIEILDREEKLQSRKEKLHAEEIVSGKGQSIEAKHEETPKEMALRVMRGELTEDERIRGQG